MRLEANGAPILAAACYCSSCQQAGHQIEQLPSAPPVLDEDGGTSFVLTDRTAFIAWRDGSILKSAGSGPIATRRVVATCCHSAMFLDFTKGHWLSIYRNRIPEGAPPLSCC